MTKPLNAWVAMGLALMLAACTATNPGHHAPKVRTATKEEMRDFVQRSGRTTVLTFVGYSGAGYENRSALLAAAEKVLEGYDPKTTIVNIGATEEGIGAVYEVAEHEGFLTTGIVSTQAKRAGSALASHCDHVFYVEDDTWGGYLPGTERLSPTSEAMVEVSTVVVAIGGGEVARDEVLAAKRLGRKVLFIPADMDHRKAIEKAATKGLPAPTEFQGAVHALF